MKKIIFIFSLALALVPASAFALNLGGGIAKDAATQAGYAPNTGVTTFAETLGTVVKGALSLVGVIFMVLMVYAGFLWMTAHGAEEQIEKAQDIIRSSIIGLIIAVGAYSITNFVLPRILEKTTGQSGGSQTVGGSGSICGPNNEGHCSLPQPSGGCGSNATPVVGGACTSPYLCCQ